MKPDEIVLRSGGGGMRENDEGSNLVKVHCKQVCKFHNETLPPLQLIHANKNTASN
jgi:hypothetical protein